MANLVSEILLATRNLTRNAKRTLVAALTVASGVTAFMLAGGFIDYIFLEMREATIRSQLGHMQIVRPDYFEKGIADPYAYLLPAASAEQAVVEGYPGVAGLTQRLAFNGLIGYKDATVPFIGEGVDPVKERPISSRITIIEGQDLTAENEASVILGEGLAKSIDVKVGESVVLLATAANGSPNAVEVKVAGTFATMTKAYDDSALRLPVGVARKLMRVNGATSWVVLLDDTANTARASRAIAEKLPKKDFEVVPWTALADFYNKTVVLFSKQVDVVKFIIGFIIVLTISNTQMMSVMERTTEIGTSLAIGLKRRVVMRLFVIESCLIGLCGGVLGLVLGGVLGWLISKIGIPMPPPPGMARGYIGKILVSPDLMQDAFVLALVATTLAGLMPAWKASRMNIVDALRTNT